MLVLRLLILSNVVSCGWSPMICRKKVLRQSNLLPAREEGQGMTAWCKALWKGLSGGCCFVLEHCMWVWNWKIDSIERASANPHLAASSIWSTETPGVRMGFPVADDGGIFTRREQHRGRIFLLGREKERRRTVLISLSQVVCPDLSTGLCPNLSSWSVLISQKFLL